MNKVKALVPMIGFVLYLLKILVLGSNYSDAISLLILSGLYAFTEIRIQNNKLEELYKQVGEIKILQVDLTKKNEELKTHVSGIRMAQGIRQVQPRI